MTLGLVNLPWVFRLHLSFPSRKWMKYTLQFCVHTLQLYLFKEVYLPPLESKADFLGISNLEHPPCIGLSLNSRFIPWTVGSAFWSEVISTKAEICWDRHPALKCLMHWHRYSLYRERKSRNMLTLDAHFLNTCVTFCWWCIWCCWMTVLDAGGSFCGPGSLKNGKQKTWHQHHHLCTQNNV